jgi:hypothetical protein
MPRVTVVCWQVEVSATGRSLIQRGPTECGVSDLDLRTATLRRLRPTRAVEPLNNKTICNSMSRRNTHLAIHICICSVVLLLNKYELSMQDYYAKIIDFFYVVRTVHFGMKLYNDQRNTRAFNLFINLLLPYMFRAFF